MVEKEKTPLGLEFMANATATSDCITIFRNECAITNDYAKVGKLAALRQGNKRAHVMVKYCF